MILTLVLLVFIIATIMLAILDAARLGTVVQVLTAIFLVLAIAYLVKLLELHL